MAQSPDPARDDPEVHEYVRVQSARMLSLPMYRRLAAVVSSWEHEERGKARVASGALAGLAVLGVLAAAAGAWRFHYAGYVLLIALPVWMAFVFRLMHVNLARR